jgi:hypothetical protein
MSTYQRVQEFKPVIMTHTTVQLETIDLSGLNNVSYHSVCLLATKCPILKNIILDGCDSVIDWYDPWTVRISREDSGYSLGKNVNDNFTPPPSPAKRIEYESDYDTDSFYSAQSGFSAPRRLTLTREQVIARKNELIRHSRQ